MEVRQCKDPIPPECEKYGEWEAWQECETKKCGEIGIRRRSRKCLVELCLEKLIDEEKCQKVISIRFNFKCLGGEMSRMVGVGRVF